MYVSRRRLLGSLALGAGAVVVGTGAVVPGTMPRVVGGPVWAAVDGG